MAHESIAKAGAQTRERAAQDVSGISIGAGAHSPSSDAGGRTSGEDEDEEDDGAERGSAKNAVMLTEVVLARLLTDTLGSLTRSFEKYAMEEGEVSCSLVFSFCRRCVHHFNRSHVNAFRLFQRR